MIDLRLARSDPGAMREAVARKGAGKVFDDLLETDAAWRAASARADELRAKSRPRSKPTQAERAALVGVREDLKRAEADRDALGARRMALWAAVPNPPEASVPDGETDEDSTELRRVGTPPSFGFEVRDHVELAALGRGSRPGFDLERGARVSGSRFGYRRGPVALVELAMYRFALDRLVELSFEPVLPPVLVRERAMYGTGFLPTEEANLYRVDHDDLYLTGTSEVALAAMHEGEVLARSDLPLRYAGYSTCFRREAGAAGRDTRGVFRVHQFDKVEMFCVVEPEASAALHEELLALEESLVTELGLAYRVVVTAAGDLGPSAAKKYDIEAWIPSQARYREITSCSNTTDYQARRLDIRYRDAHGTMRFPHTLNGTAMTARWLIALMECNQDAEGSVTVPEVLRGYGAPAVI